MIALNRRPPAPLPPAPAGRDAKEAEQLRKSGCRLLPAAQAIFVLECRTMAQFPAAGILQLSPDATCITFRLLDACGGAQPGPQPGAPVTSLRQALQLLSKHPKPGGGGRQSEPGAAGSAMDGDLGTALGWMGQNHYSAQCSGLELLLTLLNCNNKYRLWVAWHSQGRARRPPAAAAARLVSTQAAAQPSPAAAAPHQPPLRRHRSERIWEHGPLLMPALARLLCTVSAAPTHDVNALEKLARLRPGSAPAPPNDNSALAQMKLALALALEAVLQVRPRWRWRRLGLLVLALAAAWRWASLR
jgi:hypothetical protein